MLTASVSIITFLCCSNGFVKQEHKPLRSFVCNVLFGLCWKAIGQREKETGERGGGGGLVNMLFVSAAITVLLKRETRIGMIGGSWEAGGKEQERRESFFYAVCDLMEGVCRGGAWRSRGGGGRGGSIAVNAGHWQAGSWAAKSQQLVSSVLLT